MGCSVILLRQFYSENLFNFHECSNVSDKFCTNRRWRGLFDKHLGSDGFNVTTDGNTTLSRWWKRINALFVRSFKINYSDMRELKIDANAIRSSEKCSAVFQKYIVLTFRIAINVNCMVSCRDRRPFPAKNHRHCSLLQQRRPIDSVTRCIFIAMCVRFTFARILGDVLLIGIKYGTRDH